MTHVAGNERGLGGADGSETLGRDEEACTQDHHLGKGHSLYTLCHMEPMAHLPCFRVDKWIVHTTWLSGGVADLGLELPLMYIRTKVLDISGDCALRLPSKTWEVPPYVL